MLSTLPLRLLLMTSLVAAVSETDSEWKCPESEKLGISCSCDFPHTLRCVVEKSSLPILAKKLETLKPTSEISLLDCTVQNLIVLPGYFMKGVALQGLVVTSGEIKEISEKAFAGLPKPLQALGLPNNRLRSIPETAFRELSYLERLDLSHNKLSNLNQTSFREVKNLTFLDLSDNEITNFDPDSFSSLQNLKILKLKGNRLKISTVTKLKNLSLLQELDLSMNALVGPLESGTVPEMPNLKTLFLDDNEFNIISRDALYGASSLLNLSLSNNQIDVLEDDAFRRLKHLRSLNLANNRIVAVSGSSLAHLTELIHLDLSHNYLRALTAAVVVPLIALRELILDDNDISMVDREAVRKSASIERLSLSDNPLSCDCNLVDFALWFSNLTRKNPADKCTAVCATPPHLENALLAEIPVEELGCEEEDSELAPPAGPVASQISRDHIYLRAFHFDGETLNLLWKVDPKADPFTCDALFVYEDVSSHEVLLSSTPIHCNSSQTVENSTLSITRPVGNLEMGHKYRYCVVLLQGDNSTDEMQLVLGCSEVIPLSVTNRSVAQLPRAPSHVSIAFLEAGLSGNRLNVSVRLWNQKRSPDLLCHVTVTVFMMHSLQHHLVKHHLNCSQPVVSIENLPYGLYRVCATLGNDFPSQPRIQCITVENKAGGNTALIVSFVLFSAIILLGVYLIVRKFIRRLKMTNHRCFLAPSEADEEGQRKQLRYVKLQATTKL